VKGSAAAQRAAFADICAELGPDAPTLCTGWATKELVAHCYVREHRPDALPGVLPLGPLSTYTERVMASSLRVHGYGALVDAVRTPPPWVRPVDDAANTIEYFVHTEDVRRANGRDPRPTDGALERWVWPRLRRQAKLMFRRVPAYVRLVPDDGDGEAYVGKGGPTVAVHGRPTELLLLAYNRKDAARVRVVGDRDALWSARIGL
jgi:uncharacterized protein (TIGR03085 family)